MPRFGGAAALPMEREGEAAGGRAAAYFVGCCVRCVLYLCCVVVVSKFSYHTGSKTILAKSKWSTFAHSYHKICT